MNIVFIVLCATQINICLQKWRKINMIKKLWNVLLVIKNFLLILFQLKNHSDKMYEFIDRTISKMGDGEESTKTNMIYELHGLLNEMYGIEYGVEHITISRKFMNIMFNLQNEKDVLEKIRKSIKNSLDLKSFIKEFIK